MINKIGTTLVAASIATSAFAVSTKELDQRVETLEYASYENWWNFSGRLEYRFDNLETEHKKGYSFLSFDGNAKTRTAGEKHEVKRHRLFTELDMKAAPSDKLTFFGRISMTKDMNTMNKGGGNYTSEGAFNELGEGVQQDSSALFLERAFVNYSLTKNLVFSVGRLPTIEGAPAHFQEGRAPMGGYPLLAFGGIFDGLAMTYNNNFMGVDYTVRGIYTPFNQRDIGFSNQKLTDSNGMEIDESVDVYSLMLEAQKTNLSWAKKVHFTYQYLKFDGLSALSKQVVSGYNTAAGADLVNIFDGNIGLDLERHVINLEAYGIANTGLNLGFSYLKGTSTGTGNLTLACGIASNGSTTGQASCPGVSNPISLGTWGGAAPNEKKGDAWIANVSYTMSFLKNATAGIELGNFDKDAFVYDSGSKNLVGAYTASGGDSKHFYWVQPIDNNFTVKLGYQEATRKNTNYLGGFIGTESEIEDVKKAYYTSFQFNF